MPRLSARVVIAGAGVGGLKATVALRRAGHEVVLLERMPALAEIGGGINLAPNAKIALRHLGLTEAVEAAGAPLEAFEHRCRAVRRLARADRQADRGERRGGDHAKRRLRPPEARALGSGRVTLLGDAAHPTTPTLGQGACMAIEDGVVLARQLGSHDDPVAALRAFEAERIPRTAKIAKRSRMRARMVPPRTRAGCPPRSGTSCLGRSRSSPTRRGSSRPRAGRARWSAGGARPRAGSAAA